MPRHAVRRKNAPPIPCISKNARIISVHLRIEKAAAAAILNLYNVICTACPPAVGGTVQKKEEDVL